MAGTVVVSSVENLHNWRAKDQDGWIVNILATADASAATFPALTISKTTTGLGFDPRGLYLTRVEFGGYHAGTKPTDASTMYIYETLASATNGVDVLNGNGVSAISNSVNKSIFPAILGARCDWKVTADLSLALSGNSVNSAVIYIKLIFEA